MEDTKCPIMRRPQYGVQTTKMIVLLIFLTTTVCTPSSGLQPSHTSVPRPSRPEADSGTVSVRMTVTYELPQGADLSTLRSFRSPELAGSSNRADQTQVPYMRTADVNSSSHRAKPREASSPESQASDSLRALDENRRAVVSRCVPPDECKNIEECAPGGVYSSCEAGRVCCPSQVSAPRAMEGNRKSSSKGSDRPRTLKLTSLDDGMPAAFGGYLLLSEFPRVPTSSPSYANEDGVTSKSVYKAKPDQTAKNTVYDSARRGGPPIRPGTAGTTPLSKLKQSEALLPDTSDCGLVYVDNRITKGKDAQLGQFPWMVLLGFKFPPETAVNFICAGSLINDRYVLTAAHCFSSRNVLAEVRLGEFNLLKDPDGTSDNPADPVIKEIPDEVIIHPNFTRARLNNDIALIRLRNRVQEYKNTIRPICLPLDVRFDGKNYTIAGWGKTEYSNSNGTNIVQTTNVQVLNHADCIGRASPYNLPITTEQICAGGNQGQDVCSGDSGGPLMKVETANGPTAQAAFYIVGIVSFGADMPCGTARLPSVYTRVEAYMPWILENMRP